VGDDFANRIGDGATGITQSNDQFLFEYHILSKNPEAEASRPNISHMYGDRIHNSDRIQNIEEIDHHPIVYHMVTTVLDWTKTSVGNTASNSS